MKKKIYILHGWAYTTEKWQPFVTELERLGFQVVFLHIPGLTAPIDRPWILDDYVLWLHKTLSAENKPVTLLGHSNGGRISLLFAARYPEKIAELILIDSAGVHHDGTKIKIKRAVFGTLAKIGRMFSGVSYIRNFFYKIVGEKDYRDADPIMRETMQNLISVDLVPEMPKIQCPTLLIWGEHDRATPLADGKIMKEKIPHSELAVIAGARHSPQFTHVPQAIEIIKKQYAQKNL